MLGRKIVESEHGCRANSSAKDDGCLDETLRSSTGPSPGLAMAESDREVEARGAGAYPNELASAGNSKGSREPTGATHYYWVMYNCA
jgi:hypothetical protein